MKRPMTTACALGTLLALTGISAIAGAGHFGGQPTYDVTITNLTRGVSFTPLMVVSHRAAPDLLFTPGDAPSDELAALAEGGDTAPLSAMLSLNTRVLAIEGSIGLLEPGQSVTLAIQARPGRGYISMAAMLLPTNDGMVALQNMRVPLGNKAETAWAYGYDAGSEPNDELCDNIPGPHCAAINGGTMGSGGSPGIGGEGYVHIHPGIQGGVDLDPVDYDWNNPVAQVTIMRAN